MSTRVIREPEILFSDYFQVPKGVLDDYGAFDISLVTDLPLFVDPFLLFNSKDSEYQKLHAEMIRYLRFLKDKSVSQAVDKGLLDEWYRFKEVKENWLGFSVEGNRGRGLGRDFANALNQNLYKIFKDFGEERITKGSHLERLCLVKDGVGRDSISDFTTNLIKEFLLNYTQQFAIEYVDNSLCKRFVIDKVRFNFETESWERDTFYLPALRETYVLLTPKNILTKDETWINRTDLITQFQRIPDAIPNENLRSQINNYFLSVLPKEPKEKDRHHAAYQTIQRFPVLVDYFIKYKEDNGELASDLSAQRVRYSEALYLQQFMQLRHLLAQESAFYNIIGATYQEARQRVEFLKDVIENKGGYRILYVDGLPIRSEEDLHILFRLTWFGSPSDVSTEVNGGRGPVDFKISRGSRDKTLVEFKLARNTHLKRNLEKQLEIYKKAENTDKGLYVIVYFNEDELKRVQKIVGELNLESARDIVLIDARSDNKVSASKA